MKLFNRSKNENFFLIVAIVGLVVIVVIFIILRFTGIVSKKPSTVASDYFDSYINNDSDAISKIDYAFDDQLTSKQKKEYVKVMKRQYKKMFYSVLDEKKDGRDATVKLEVTVFDYNACYNTAVSHINTHSNKFSTVEKQVDYKISKLGTCSERVTYVVNLEYHYNGMKWLLNELSDDDSKKINGVY